MGKKSSFGQKIYLGLFVFADEGTFDYYVTPKNLIRNN